MKAYIITLVTILLSTITVYSQTNLIAHKSHSGTADNFHKAMDNGFADLALSSFGVAPTPIVNDAKLDTIKYISDTVSIMITSNYCRNRYTDSTKFWTAGTDTLYHHQLFSKKNNLDSIKSVLKEQYNFRNPIDSVVFMGYDTVINVNEDKKANKTKNSIPPFSDNKSEPPSNLKLISFAVILLLALIIGFIGKNVWINKDSFGKAKSV